MRASASCQGTGWRIDPKQGQNWLIGHTLLAQRQGHPLTAGGGNAQLAATGKRNGRWSLLTLQCPFAWLDLMRGPVEGWVAHGSWGQTRCQAQE